MTDQYTRDRLAECQTETERLAVLAFIRIEEKAKKGKPPLTTMALFCQSFGWTDCDAHTIDDAKRRFLVASVKEMDRTCTLMAAKIGEVSDPRMALWFLQHRRQARQLHIQGLTN